MENGGSHTHLSGTYSLIDVLKMTPEQRECIPNYRGELVQPFVDLVFARPSALVGTDRSITAAKVFQHFSNDELNSLPSHDSFALFESRLKAMAELKSLKSKAKLESEAQFRENLESIFASLGKKTASDSTSMCKSACIWNIETVS